ncbi:MAG TPA: HAD family hydrolase [Sedimentisphaerales bacterium]|nr:HAD family hydrolase [Sedimentisphaerales bacterium]
MPPQKIKAVLFDLGETVLNYGKVNASGLFRQGARLSYDFLKNCAQQPGSFEYYCWRNLIAFYLRRLISHITGKDFNALLLLRSVGTKKRIQLNRQQWRQFAWLWYEPLSKVASIELNLAQTLGSLKEKGLKLGIVSNTFVHSSSLERHLEQLGILDFFTVRVYSYEFDFRKPDIRIFKIAAERLGETLENILFVGDRIDKDVRPAVKSGMPAVLKKAYTNAGKRLPKGAWLIDHLAELPELIEKINGKKEP